MVYILAFDKVTKELTESFSMLAEGNYEEIPSKGVIQEFTCSEGKLEGIDLYFTNNTDNSDGYILIKIANSKDTIWVGKVSISNIATLDEKWIYLGLKIEDSEEIYRLTIDSDEVMVPNLLVVGNSDSAIESKATFINGEELIDKKIAVKYSIYEKPSCIEKFIGMIKAGIPALVCIICILYADKIIYILICNHFEVVVTCSLFRVRVVNHRNLLVGIRHDALDDCSFYLFN